MKNGKRQACLNIARCHRVLCNGVWLTQWLDVKVDIHWMTKGHNLETRNYNDPWNRVQFWPDVISRSFLSLGLAIRDK